MRKRKLLYFIAITILISINSCKISSTNNKNHEKPNVIIILIDDAGYADFGFAGSKDIKTPNIDKLAGKGVIFTNAHVSASVCGPSRAGIITGRYQQRFGFECNPPENFSGLALDESTIGNLMKKGGYKTAAFGKWHLGDTPEYRPNARGFDYFWGFLAGSRHYFSNPEEDQPGNTRSIRENDAFTNFDGYLTDKLAEKAVDFIDRNKEEPFFIYWAPNAVHTPLQATQEDLNRFEGHPRQMLAAMSWALDRAIGKIEDKLEKENLSDNTLIFFLSDNGGAHNNQSSNYPLKGFKGNKYEGGIHVPFIVSWPSMIDGGTRYDGLTSSLDILATSLDAANISEAPRDLDGTSLIPFLTGKNDREPHELLFWRKGAAAAARVSNYKLIRVNRLGQRLYDLKENPGENIDLTEKAPEISANLNQELKNWEKQIISPLWTEGATWDTITWMIHEDLFNNRKVRVKDLQGLIKYIENEDR